MKQTWIMGVTLLVAFALVATPIVAKDKNKSIEQYQANAIVQTGGGSSVAQINIYRWSTDEERAELLEAIEKATEDPPKNSREIAKALRGQKKVGYAFFAGKQGYPLRYARQFDVDGVRTIILATDRPVGTQEATHTSRMSDFDVSIVMLKVGRSPSGARAASSHSSLHSKMKETMATSTDSTPHDQ